MKKVWEKPKLVLLCRGRDEEVLLSGVCKMSGDASANNVYVVGCSKLSGCGACNFVSTS